jgi:lipid II:glycine glycyltransferase (peptidoglycan interpeptide bridge formation enzyme)
MQDVCDQNAGAVGPSTLEEVAGPVWQVEVDRATPTEWSRMIDLFDDANLYQTWPYGEVRWDRRNLSHLVLKRNDEVAAIAQLRIVRPTKLNFGMAYLRWGPLFQRRGEEPDAEVLAQMAGALSREYSRKRRLLLQILPNAFLGSNRCELFQSGFSGFTEEPSANLYRTFLVDLAPPIGELRRNLDAKWRNKLTRSEKNDLTITAGSGIDEYRTFCLMHDEMRKRKGFETTVNVEEFRKIQEDLPAPHRMRVLICEQKGTPVAGIVVSAMGDSAIYVLGATSDDGLNSKGSYLLQWTMIQWLKSNGFRWYDLGGIDPQANPGVYSFKKGLSGIDVMQLSPLVMCSSVISSAVVRATLAANRIVKSLTRSLAPRELPKPDKR